MDQFQIETAQNISITQNTSNLGERMLAYLIDSFVIGVYTILVFILLISLDIELADQWAYYLVLSLPAFLYYLLFETFSDGKTIGKGLMSLRVVKLDGSKPSFANYFVRWVLRIIDVALTSGGGAVLAILIRGKGQRLGDMAAGTTVISEKKRVSLRDTLLRELPEDFKPQFPQVTVFKDAEMQTIKELYDKSKLNGDHNVIISLDKRIKEVTGIQTSLNPVDFVDLIIKDYNYYTQKNVTMFYLSIDILGTVAFAISGVLVAMEKRLDLFGVLIIAFVTAIGGGTLRDLLIGNTPVVWMRDLTYVSTIFITVVFGIIFVNHLRYLRRSLFLFDTIGIGLYTMVGIEKGLQAELSPIMCIALGTMTASFGGVIRDMLCNEIPVIFRKEIYATACILGGASYFLFVGFPIPESYAYVAAILVVIALRLLAVRFGISLPNIYRKAPN